MAGREALAPGVGTQTLVPLNFSAVVAPLDNAVKILYDEYEHDERIRRCRRSLSEYENIRVYEHFPSQTFFLPEIAPPRVKILTM